MNRIVFSALMCGISLINALQADTTQSSDRISLGIKKEQNQRPQKSQEKLLLSKINNKRLTSKCYGPAETADTPWLGYSLTRDVNSVGVNGLTLTMDDQTIWEIAPGSASIAKRWDSGTSFVIYPNNWTIGSWISQYDYALYNEQTGCWIEARLSEGPFVKYAVLTADIDYNRGYLRLDNGSIWQIPLSSIAYAKLRSWQGNQAILVGKNTGWLTPSYILININENEYLPADFLGFQ